MGGAGGEQRGEEQGGGADHRISGGVEGRRTLDAFPAAGNCPKGLDAKMRVLGA
jgi:hypothetical protein